MSDSFLRTLWMNSTRPATWWLSLVIFTIVSRVRICAGHGRLIEPPSRASAWRYGFQTPPDYNDHELYCGGFTRQWKRNGGKCGECGDAWDVPQPRPHENGGQWGQGVIVRKYSPAAEITIRIELTASHMGYFEFRLCPEPDAKQDCLDRHLLKILSGSPAQPTLNDLDTRFYPRNGSRIYDIRAQLPDLKCVQCVMQWRYVAGNNWGMCADGNGAVGCGPQEEFRSCSDIALGAGAHTPIRPIRPTSRTTVRPTNTSTESTQQESDEDFDYVSTIIICVIIFLVLCALSIWYLYRYKRQVVKWVESSANRFCWKQNKNVAAVGTPRQQPITTIVAETTSPYTLSKTVDAKNFVLDCPPKPPPRAKRQSRVKELSPDESSIA